MAAQSARLAAAPPEPGSYSEVFSALDLPAGSPRVVGLRALSRIPECRRTRRQRQGRRTSRARSGNDGCPGGARSIRTGRACCCSRHCAYRPGPCRCPNRRRRRGDRGVRMPKRRRTRAQDLAYRIAAERRLNDAYVAERNRAAALPRGGKARQLPGTRIRAARRRPATCAATASGLPREWRPCNAATDVHCSVDRLRQR